MFVEIVITWEFGEQLLQDPQFTELTKDVVKTMEQDPTTWKQLQTLLYELRRH